MESFLEKTLQNGFAIAVASFLLIRTDKRLEELKDAILRLASVLAGKIETGGVQQ